MAEHERAPEGFPIISDASALMKRLEAMLDKAEPLVDRTEAAVDRLEKSWLAKLLAKFGL